MALTNISASLTVSISTNGFSALQPTSPVQLFTPSTGQRAFTLSDTINLLNEQTNANTDPTSNGTDSPDPFYGFTTSSDGLAVIDAITISTVTQSTWDASRVYAQGVWA